MLLSQQVTGDRVPGILVVQARHAWTQADPKAMEPKEAAWPTAAILPKGTSLEIVGTLIGQSGNIS